MTSRILAPAILSIAMFATPALAATAGTPGVAGTRRDENNPGLNAPMTPPEECSYLQTKFDTWIKTHSDVEKTPEARQLRAKGEELCNAGNTEKGIENLKQALNDINVPAVED